MSKVYIMVGVPASGKSTYVKEHLGSDVVVLSSDALRGELLGDETRQDKNAYIFRELYNRAKRFVKEGRDIVIDATSIDRERRAKVLSHFDLNKVEVVAIYLDTPIEECYTRDEARNRTVGRSVIDKFAGKLEVPTIDEGFSEVIVVKQVPNEYF